MNAAKSILTLLLLSLQLCGRANDFTSLHIDSDNGLSQSTVKSIAQDKYGFIWLGTKNGLNRYDGHQIMHVDVRDDKRHFANQNVSALYSAKNGTLWVGTDEGVYTYDSNSCTFNHIMDKAQDGTQITGWIANIAEDKHERIWITVGEQGIYSYHNGKLKRYLYNLPQHEMPCFLLVCTDGSIWACSWNQGLFLYDENFDRFISIKQDANGKSLCGLQMNTLAQLDNELIIGVQNGKLLRYDMRQNILSPITDIDLSHTVVRNAAVYGRDIWIGTQDGLYILNNDSKKTIHLRHNHNQSPRSPLSDNIVYCTFRDREGGVWAGTMFGGADYLKQESKAFKHICTDNFGNAIAGYRIRDIIEYEGNIYVGAEDDNIGKIDIKTGRITNYPTSATPLAFFISGQGLQSSLSKKSIIKVDGKGDSELKPILEKMGINSRLFSIYAITSDTHGFTWIATDIGVIKMSEKNHHAEYVDAIHNSWIYDIAVDNKGDVWFASMGNGVWRYSSATGRTYHYSHKKDDIHSLSSNSVSSITIDHTGTPWFSTDRGGICRYNQKTNDFTRYSKEEGLPDDIAYKIVEDNDGFLWFGTNQGLVRLNPTKGDIRVFTTRDGLPGNQFNYKGGILASDGNIYMATLNGLLAFSPHLSQQGTVKEIFFTNLKISGHDVSPTSPDSPLENNILLTDHLTLGHDQTNITLSLSSLLYSTIMVSNYEYRLDPIDKEWHSVGASSEISYASLAPGTYHLHIRVQSDASQNEYVERELTIEVLPVWWLSTTAYVIYTLLLLSIALFIFRRYQRRQREKFNERQRIYEIEKEKELYKKKVDFFTEVAHEIRTPLTLINGPLEIINKMKIDDPTLKKNLNVIGLNTRRLLSLASQLLDFRKVGTDQLKPTIEQVDINHLLTATVERFEPTFNNNGKSLSIVYADEDITANIDLEAITKVLSNLLNNALKYSKSNTTISLKKEGDQLRLTVFSDGAHIPQEESEHIFEPFVRLNNGQEKRQTGSGIGLPLARSLAQLHKGQLFLDPSITDGNAFVLTLPLNLTSSQAEKAEKAKEMTATPDYPLGENVKLTNENSRGRTILVVEDEKDILELIAEQLQNFFIVEKASNGVEALEILQKEHIDLVVSDVMMPEMNGVELCQKIKTDIKLSHIPVVFLTAKNDTDSKIEGLKAGAEAYVEKPFSFEYLLTQIKSLLINRAKEREAFSKRPFFPIDNIQMSKEDEEMMQKVMDIINENINDEDFNVEKLADIMCMSRSSLLRKIKQLFNMPPLEFIRLVRLKKAAELIQEGNHRIGEICYMVGFSNPSYFAKMFNRQFGLTPKEFEQHMAKLRTNMKEKDIK